MLEAILKDKEVGRKIFGNLRNISLPMILI
jgi:hypothetical protein